MTRFKKTLLGFGLAIGLLSVPLGAGSQALEVLTSEYTHHRFSVSDEGVWHANGEALANYAMFELTDLERVAGRENLDQATIHFLEDNIWDYDDLATFEGDTDPVAGLTDEELRTLGGGISDKDETDIGVYDVDPDMFSEEIHWQDRNDEIANPA